MIYSFSLDQQNIPCDKICFNIQKLIEQYKNTNPNISNSLVVITIKEITDSHQESEPLRLTVSEITS
jgi:hypothetical protein